ncbi:unnamed protein product [Citrullus colocynthis]|uniref:Peroxidase n=1 Tax=Citrullus colocynthis TaxID=252529 RepID=A0ABP0Z077_9ROSI
MEFGDVWRRRRIGWLLVLIISMGIFARKGEGQLVENFYKSTCPNVEQIVRQAVQNKFSQTTITIPATLILFFHDCFVEGCDASVMISSPSGDAVEAACLDRVSCADILALAARDAVVLTGGPNFNVELGRRDGLISKASSVDRNLPSPNFDLNALTSMFARHGLSQTNMIALSGAHTIGASHCNCFFDRLFSTSGVDPSLNPAYAEQLKQVCPRNVDPSVVVKLDPTTPNTFDNLYYRNLMNRKGLFRSNEVLFTSSASKGTVVGFANNERQFNTTFVEAMQKLGRVGVKTGRAGEIRRDW